MAQTRDTKTAREAPAPAGGDIYAQLIEIAGEQPGKAAYYQRCFRAIAAHFTAPFGLASVRLAAGNLDDRYTTGRAATNRWERIAEAVLLATQSEMESIARLYRARGKEVLVTAMSAVVRDEHGAPLGAMVVFTRCRDERHGEALLSELRALAALVSGRVPDGAEAQAAAEQQESGLSRAIVRAAQYASVAEFAFALTNNLRNKAGCDQVTLGTVRNRRARILAISGFDDVKPRSPGTVRIRQAMEECVDRGEVIVYQHDDTWATDGLSTGHRLHRQWHETVGNASVASIPLMVEERCVAVVSLRREAKQPFSPDELQSLREMVEPFAPSLALVARAGRGLYTHVADNLHGFLAWLVRPTGFGRKLVMVGMLAFLAWFCLGTMTHEITLPCTIRPAKVRHFAAPFEGVIAEVRVEPGDVVSVGDVLARLDTAALELERDQMRAELQVSQVRINQAVAINDLATANLASAEMDVVRAQLTIIEGKIQRATLRAHADGVVLSGDLAPRVGQTVTQGEPLLEMAPESGWFIELQVPEADVALLREGLRGRFASHARPDAMQACALTRIRPATEIRDGRNVFIADADIEHLREEWMRTGMEGVARIDAGERPVWWIALHRIIDAAHMRLWL